MKDESDKARNALRLQVEEVNFRSTCDSSHDARLDPQGAVAGGGSQREDRQHKSDILPRQ